MSFFDRSFSVGLATLSLLLGISLCTIAHGANGPSSSDTSILPLTVRGEDFVNPAGKSVRFWGVNLVALYPDHSAADALAKNLADLQVNLVRPHHNLRPSSDWNPKMASGALLTYKGDSRHFDADALDRFDYLNGALRRNGIYLSFSLNWTRRYFPGDAAIITSTDADRDAWSAAMKELNGWGWQKGFDVYKTLPVLDERVAKLNEEFARNILAHVNPYTGLAYGKDPQVLTLELLNEASTEYTIVCGNHLPDYWQKQLVAKWEAFAKKAGVAPGDLYKPADTATRAARAQFLRGLDEAYFERMKAVVREAGCTTPMMFSNLWRGDNELQMQSVHSDVIENHIYKSPLVVQSADDFVSPLAKNAVAGKPFFVGELNQSENAAATAREAPFRSMLPLAAAAYGSLQNWSGIEYFAWIHGSQTLGSNGWAISELRKPDLGRMSGDGVMIDHLRTTGILFRRGLVAPSAQPITIAVDAPYTAGDYNGLMRGKYVPRAGWQDIHAIRKTFSPAPAGQASAEWMTLDPPSPLVSDTGEIVKDIQRSQLTVAAAKAEAFSGTLDGAAPRGLRYLNLTGSNFATVVMVADDDQNLELSNHVIISRTSSDAAGADCDGPTISLHGMKHAPQGQQWTLRINRSRSHGNVVSSPTKVEQAAGNDLQLPTGDWTECDLQLTP